MFTVVIAEKNILDRYEQYRLFMAPLLQNSEVAFCEWNRQAETLDAMVPDLNEIIAKHEDWRAVIVQPDGRCLKNPFDFTSYSEPIRPAKGSSWSYLSSRRKERFACYEKALENPLTKLASALCGPPVFLSLIEDKKVFDSVVSGESHPGEFMLSQQLAKLKTNEIVNQFEGKAGFKLNPYVEDKNRTRFLKALSENDVRDIFELVGEDSLIGFIKMIGNNDSRFSDPEYSENILENTKKSYLFDSISPAFDYKNTRPSEVVCVALRTYDSGNYDNKVTWSSAKEQEYSRFAEFNLYPEKLRYILFDVKEDDHKQFNFDLIRFLCFLMILAGNEIPSGVLSKARLYSAGCECDLDNLSFLLTSFDEKLRKTARMLEAKQRDAIEADRDRIGSDSYAKTLETPVSIPLTFNGDFSVNQLLLEYRSVGLSKDCPTEEQIFFESQYSGIRKRFQYFLKQPRRSLIRATEDIKLLNTVIDDEAFYLDAFQLEDIHESINEAEQKIVSAVTANIFDSSRYYEKMEESRKEVRAVIDTRMERRTAVMAGLIAIGAYFLGFIPLFISSANSAKSFAFSGIFTIIACAVFAGIGIGCLFYLRYRLVKVFKKFNKSMRNISGEVRTVMQNFSAYLSHVCSFMRGIFAVNLINESEKKGVRESKIFRKHIQDIQRTREEFKHLFCDISPSDDVDISSIEAYDYDFSRPINYSFELPFESTASGMIEFLQKGHMVDLPVSFIKKISLEREELYNV